MAENEIKPRTIPDALGLTDRKYKAIYAAVEETIRDKDAIDALIDLKTTFTDVDELVFAIYAYSVKIGYAKAGEISQEKIEAAAHEEGAKAFLAGQLIALAQVKALEKRGIIKFVDQEVRQRVHSIKTEEIEVPDEILYGISRAKAGEKESAEPAEETPTEKPVAKKKTSESGNDPMYG